MCAADYSVFNPLTSDIPVFEIISV